jgi:hypothetical protein
MIKEFKKFVNENFKSVHAFVKKYGTTRSSAYERYNKSDKYYVAIIEKKLVVVKVIDVLHQDEI